MERLDGADSGTQIIDPIPDAYHPQTGGTPGRCHPRVTQRTRRRRPKTHGRCAGKAQVGVRGLSGRAAVGPPYRGGVRSTQVGSACEIGYGIGVAMGASARHGATGEFDDKRGAAWHLMVLPGAGAAWIARKPFQR
jgi:hypothetical protein